jgi:hypothetical protein
LIKEYRINNIAWNLAHHNTGKIELQHTFVISGYFAGHEVPDSARISKRLTVLMGEQNLQ